MQHTGERGGGSAGWARALHTEQRAHSTQGGGDLGVFAQQAHMGLNKGEIFFLRAGRVSGGPGWHSQGSLLSVLPHTQLHPPPLLTSTLRTDGSGASSGQSGSSW